MAVEQSGTGSSSRDDQLKASSLFFLPKCFLTAKQQTKRRYAISELLTASTKCQLTTIHQHRWSTVAVVFEVFVNPEVSIPPLGQKWLRQFLPSSCPELLFFLLPFNHRRFRWITRRLAPIIVLCSSLLSQLCLLDFECLENHSVEPFE